MASDDSNSISRFSRAAGGQLSYDGCLNNDGSSGCGDLPGTPLTGADSVAVSPDGESIYVASRNANSISHFFRKLPSPQTNLVKATINRKSRRATFRFASSQEGSGFLCKLDRGSYVRCRSPKTYRHLGAGKHTFAVKAKNRQGTLDPTAAERSFQI